MNNQDLLVQYQTLKILFSLLGKLEEKYEYLRPAEMQDVGSPTYQLIREVTSVIFMCLHPELVRDEGIKVQCEETANE